MCLSSFVPPIVVGAYFFCSCSFISLCSPFFVSISAVMKRTRKVFMALHVVRILDFGFVHDNFCSVLIRNVCMFVCRYSVDCCWPHLALPFLCVSFVDFEAANPNSVSRYFYGPKKFAALEWIVFGKLPTFALIP